MQSDIDELFVRALQGDQDALNEFCSRVRPGLIQIVVYRIFSIPREEAEDLVQDVLMVFVSKYKQVTGSPTYYLRTILYNKIGNHLQRQKTLRTNHQGSLDGIESTNHKVASDRHRYEEQIANQDMLERAERVIGNMSEPCRTLMIGLIEGYAINEIWERMQEAEPNLKRAAFDRRLYSCRRKLWALLGVEL